MPVLSNEVIDADMSGALQSRVHEAITKKTPLQIIGGGSKSFYGRSVDGRSGDAQSGDAQSVYGQSGTGEVLSIANHRGIVNYEPSELVITARAGTPLNEIEILLASHGQMLAFEPPRFGLNGTLGGAIASGLSGPRRPYVGRARDFVLGVKSINGEGEMLRFGGQVMKNVAGFDVSRLLTGSLGTLGILLEVSLKVLPLPEVEKTLLFECDETDAIARMNTKGGHSLPLSGAFFESGQLHFRFSGSAATLRAAQARAGGEELANGSEGRGHQERPDATNLWDRLRDQHHHFFQRENPLWRLSVPPATPPLNLPGACLLDWGGAQRWLKSDAPASTIRAVVNKVGGHATLYRGGDRHSEVFHPLTSTMMTVQKRIKNAFDPHGIFNTGRIYFDF